MKLQKMLIFAGVFSVAAIVSADKNVGNPQMVQDMTPDKALVALEVMNIKLDLKAEKRKLTSIKEKLKSVLKEKCTNDKCEASLLLRIMEIERLEEIDNSEFSSHLIRPLAMIKLQETQIDDKTTALDRYINLLLKKCFWLDQNQTEGVDKDNRPIPTKAAHDAKELHDAIIELESIYAEKMQIDFQKKQIATHLTPDLQARVDVTNLIIESQGQFDKDKNAKKFEERNLEIIKQFLKDRQEKAQPRK